MTNLTWIPKQAYLPPCDMECDVLNESFDEEWTAWYDNYYQAFFLPDYFVPIEVTHWKPRLNVI